MCYSSPTAAQGFTLVELAIVVALAVLIGAIGVPVYREYVENAKVAAAVADMKLIETYMVRYRNDNQGQLPPDLPTLGVALPADPWGNNYAYLNIEAGGANPGRVRKDRNLVPLNTDFDLYSSGKDGESRGPLTARPSRDDVIRANNGAYVGRASEY